MLSALQGVHRLAEAEDPRKAGADVHERLLHGHFLIPVLQQVGVLPRQQPETFIQRHRLDGLPRATPVDRAPELEQSKHMADLTPMQIGQPARCAAIVHAEPLPHIARAEQIQPALEDVVTELQHPLPQPLLHLMRRAPFIERALHKHQDGLELLHQGLAVDLTGRVGHALHRGLLGFSHLPSRQSLAGRSPGV
jgi:hypothetical protein